MTLHHSPVASHRLQHGFTLVEVLIVVAIVGILATLGFPSYLEQVRKSRRADAVRGLMEAEQYMRRYFGTRDSFEGVTLPAGLAVAPRPASGAASYNIQLIENGGPVATSTALSATTFTLRATRTGNMAGDRCGDLSVTNTGVKTLTNNATGTTVGDCFKGS